MQEEELKDGTTGESGRRTGEADFGASGTGNTPASSEDRREAREQVISRLRARKASKHVSDYPEKSGIDAANSVIGSAESGQSDKTPYRPDSTSIDAGRESGKRYQRSDRPGTGTGGDASENGTDDRDVGDSGRESAGRPGSRARGVQLDQSSLPGPKLIAPPQSTTQTTQEEKRGRGRSKKEKPDEKNETPSDEKILFFKGARVWSPEYAESRRKDIREMLEGYFQDIDNILSAISQKEQVVWSNCTEDEITLLTDFCILRAEHSAEAARVISIAIEYRVYVGVAAICLPRAMSTFLISIEAMTAQLKPKGKKAQAQNVRVVDATPFQR